VARLAVLASGNGSNFEAIAEALTGTRHSLVCMICDRKAAKAFARAERLGVEAFYIPYAGRTREEAEADMIRVLGERGADLVALAGFMRLLTPRFLGAYRKRVVNIHPALLPRHPGTRGIEESYNSGDRELGITIHWVDEGMDTGPIIRQAGFTRRGGESLEEIEERIHRVERETYPKVIIGLLDGIEAGHSA